MLNCFAKKRPVNSKMQYSISVFHGSVSGNAVHQIPYRSSVHIVFDIAGGNFNYRILRMTKMIIA